MSTYKYEIIDNPLTVPENIRQQFADGNQNILTFDEELMRFIDSKKMGREFKHFNWRKTTPENIANSDLPTYNDKFIVDTEDKNIAYLKVRKCTSRKDAYGQYIYEKIYVKRTTDTAAAPAAAAGSAAAAAGLGKKRRKSKSRNKKRRSRSINKKQRSRSRKNF